MTKLPKLTSFTKASTRKIKGKSGSLIKVVPVKAHQNKLHRNPKKA